MKNTPKTFDHDPKDLLKELNSLIAEVEKTMGEAASEQSESVMSALRERVAAAEERLGEIYASAREKVVAGAEFTDETIRANPYESLAIAAGVGLLVGVLVGRSSKK